METHPHGEKPNTCLSRGHLFPHAACLTTNTMKSAKEKSNRIIGLDMHPDVFAAAAIEKTTADLSKTLWVKDRLATARLEDWAKQSLKKDDVLVLEASGNSFEVASRFHALGYTCLGAREPSGFQDQGKLLQ